MSQVSFATQIKELSLKECSEFGAMHGTSFALLESLTKVGEITGGGNFDNHFYVLVETNTQGVSIEEGALFYARVNAIKDLLFSKYPHLQEKVKNDFDPYLFLIGLSQLASTHNHETTLPTGFNIFSSEDLEAMKKIISQAKHEDRQGVIIYFTKKLLNDFSPDQITETGQARILLSTPLTLDYICSIQLLGSYEKLAVEHLR